MRGSVAVATRLNISPLVIGLTLVGFGTSLPELTASVAAALSGAPGLAVGNIVGSNIANVLLILGLAALVRPVLCQADAFRRDAAALLLTSALAAFFIHMGHIGRFQGVFLAASLVGYVAFVVWRSPGAASGAADLPDHQPRQGAQMSGAWFSITAHVAGGLCGVIGGAWLFVFGATELAGVLGVSETFVGLTVVAVGTSLPELVISVIASLRGRSDVALGNVMGSNIFNAAGILGVTAIVQPIDVPPDLRTLDLLMMLGAGVILLLIAEGRLLLLNGSVACADPV